ncbi:hypothetical protein J6W32_03975 [bacterium]|nr:hypothetical protein [bacterium]MBP5783722.1 hypothetical protein [bacterium]
MDTKNTDTKINDLKSLIEQSKQDKANLVSNIKELTKVNKDLQNQIDQLNKIIKQKDALIASQKADLNKKEIEVQKYCTTAIDARKKMDALNKEIINYRVKTNDALNKLAASKEKYQSLVETYNNLVADNKAKNIEINSLRNENADLDHSYKVCQKENESLSKQLMQYNEVIRRYQEYLKNKQ